ncbi:MAG: GIN domain-containing protein, partial [Betaproteobacteria bacterium]
AAEETRTVAGFEAVALETSDRVRVELAESPSVRVSGSPRAIEAIETVLETRNGVPTLVIRSKHRAWFGSSSGVQVFVQGPRFQALSVAGSGQLEATLSNQPALRLSMAGSGELRVRGVTTHRAEVNVAGSGDARVNARQRLRVNVAGSGDVRYTGAVKDVSSSVMGSGTVKRD